MNKKKKQIHTTLFSSIIFLGALSCSTAQSMQRKYSSKDFLYGDEVPGKYLSKISFSEGDDEKGKWIRASIHGLEENHRFTKYLKTGEENFDSIKLDNNGFNLDEGPSGIRDLLSKAMKKELRSRQNKSE